MSSIQIQPIDSDVQEIIVQVSSLGVYQKYSLTQANHWQMELQQEFGTFAYIEVEIDGVPCCATPLSTENAAINTWRFSLDAQQIYPITETNHIELWQYGWGLALILLMLSFKWNRS